MARHGDFDMSGGRPGASSSAGVSRRTFLAGVAASSLALGAGAARVGPAAAVPANGTTSTGGAPAAVRGGLRRFSRPVIQPGYQLRLPGGLDVTPSVGFVGTDRRRMSGLRGQAWPVVPAASGGSVDLSIAPPPGAPSESACLTGFRDGWYELVDTNGDVVARTEWDAAEFPWLHVWQEWGASTEYPFWGRFYSLGLEPFSEYVLTA